MSTWHLGPLGGLRPLTCPEPNISTSLVRYGGVHQGLSGARTVDVTGHRHEYTFDYTYMERDEWSWLNALHIRHVPGPFRLLDPMKPNRLSPQATALKYLFSVSGLGISKTGSDLVYQRDWPPAADPGTRSLELATFNDGYRVWFDWSERTAIQPLETITGSVYVRATTASQTFSLRFMQFDAAGADTDSVVALHTATTSWARYSVTATVPAGCESVVFTLRLDAKTSNVRIAAPQVEAGAVVTPWSLGGGAPVVHIDQLSTTSPLFPLTDCTLKLLEA